MSRKKIVSLPPEEMNRQLADEGYQVGVAMTGGGLEGLAPVLNAGGASGWLEALWFPYAQIQLQEFLNMHPEKYVSEATAVAMAREACNRVLTSRPTELVIGIGVTSKLTYPGERQGREHEICMAMFCAEPIFDGLSSISYTMVPQGETRQDQELEAGLAVQLLLNTLLREYKAN